MTTRTTSRTVTFRHRFMLDGFERELPAGTYLVQTEEELMDTVLSVAWRRVSTVIRLRTGSGTQDISIDPEQLTAALSRDGASPNPASSEAAAPPPTPGSTARNPIADRAHKR